MIAASVRGRYLQFSPKDPFYKPLGMALMGVSMLFLRRPDNL